MSQRRHLLSALAALTLGTSPALAGDDNADLTAASSQAAAVPVALLQVVTPFDLAAELARVSALSGAATDDLARRLAECLQDSQLASGAGNLEDLVWSNARSLECLATVQLAQAQVAQAEIY
jgi:hypothetical protein